MCGICGELRLDGAPVDLGATHDGPIRRRGPDHDGSWTDGPLLFGHRRLAIIDLCDRSRPADGRSRSGAGAGVQRLHLQLPGTAAELLAKGYRFFSDGDTEVILKAYAEWGEQLRRASASACSPSRSGAGASARCFWPATGSASSRCTTAATPGAFRFASSSQALLAARGRGHRHRPGGAAPLLTLHCGRARTAHHSARRPQAGPGTR